MLFGTKVMAIVGIVAIICAISAAFVLLNQNNDTSDLSGNWTLYDLNGINESGMESFIESGGCRIYFGYHDRDNCRY